MEFLLNLEWVMLAAAMCWLWVRHRPRGNRGWLAQFVSLELVLVMMFVVITTYDDMAMAKNPAETRCFQREDDLGAHAHVPLYPAVASLPARAAELAVNAVPFTVLGSPLIPAVKIPVLSSIQNRPPPAA